MSRKDVENAFNNIDSNINSLKSIVNTELTQLEIQREFKPIKKMQELYLKNCSISENESGYSKSIRLYVPKDCINILSESKEIPFGSESWGCYSFSYNNTNSIDNFYKVLNAIEAIDLERNKTNYEAAEHNKKTRDALLKMLSDIGIPKQHNGYATNRSRSKSWINYSWYSELFSFFPVGVDSVDDYKKRAEENFMKLYNADQEKRKQEKQQKENEMARKESERELAFMLSKYELEITADWEDLLCAIINQNKYLYLAYYLRKNRGDWNDGYSYAEIGLDNFDVVTEQDQEIFDCINEIIKTHEDIDGRVFRDCYWSYDVLFGIAEEQNPNLYADYKKACSKIEEC